MIASSCKGTNKIESRSSATKVSNKLPSIFFIIHRDVSLINAE